MGILFWAVIIRLFADLLLIGSKYSGFQSLADFGLDGMNDIFAYILAFGILIGCVRHCNELCVLGLDHSDIVDNKSAVHSDRSHCLEGLAVLDDLADFNIKLHAVFSSFPCRFLYE